MGRSFFFLSLQRLDYSSSFTTRIRSTVGEVKPAGSASPSSFVPLHPRSDFTSTRSTPSPLRIASAGQFLGRNTTSGHHSHLQAKLERRQGIQPHVTIYQLDHRSIQDDYNGLLNPTMKSLLKR